MMINNNKKELKEQADSILNKEQDVAAPPIKFDILSELVKAAATNTNK